VTILTPTRRGLFKVLGGIIAAPAIVRADALMKVVAPKPEFVTLADYCRLLDDANLKLANEIFYGKSIIDDLAFDGLSSYYDRPTIRTSLPATAWRKFNQGVET
jgi:hypothetical protein